MDRLPAGFGSRDAFLTPGVKRDWKRRRREHQRRIDRYACIYLRDPNQDPFFFFFMICLSITSCQHVRQDDRHAVALAVSALWRGLNRLMVCVQLTGQSAPDTCVCAVIVCGACDAIRLSVVSMDASMDDVADGVSAAAAGIPSAPKQAGVNRSRRLSSAKAQPCVAPPCLPS